MACQFVNLVRINREGDGHAPAPRSRGRGYFLSGSPFARPLRENQRRVPCFLVQAEIRVALNLEFRQSRV
jgi:hypothetical protein